MILFAFQSGGIGSDSRLFPTFADFSRLFPTGFSLYVPSLAEIYSYKVVKDEKVSGTLNSEH